MSGANFNDTDSKPSTPSNGDGTAGQILTSNGSGMAPSWEAAGGGSGDVVGPASSTDNSIARYDGITGKLLQNSGVRINDDGSMSMDLTNGQIFMNGASNLDYSPAGPLLYGTATYFQVNVLNGAGSGVGYTLQTQTQLRLHKMDLKFNEDYNHGIIFLGGQTLFSQSTGVEFTGDFKIIGTQHLETSLFGAGNNVLVPSDTYVVKTAITGGGDTITLPDATLAVNDGIRIMIKDGGNATAINTITVDTGGELIDGSASMVIVTAYGWIEVFSANSQWYVASRQL